MSRRASAGDQSILKYKLVFKYGAPGETGWIALQVVELATFIGVAARRNSHRFRHLLSCGSSRLFNSGMRCSNVLMSAQGSPVSAPQRPPPPPPPPCCAAATGGPLRWPLLDRSARRRAAQPALPLPSPPGGRRRWRSTTACAPRPASGSASGLMWRGLGIFLALWLGPQPPLRLALGCLAGMQGVHGNAGERVAVAWDAAAPPAA